MSRADQIDLEDALTERLHKARAIIWLVAHCPDDPVLADGMHLMPDTTRTNAAWAATGLIDEALRLVTGKDKPPKVLGALTTA